MGNMLIRATIGRDNFCYLVRLHKNTTSIKVLAQWVLSTQGYEYNHGSIINQTEPKVLARLGSDENPQEAMSTNITIEYPVKDDGVSKMYDMNQIIYEDGQPIAKQIR